VWLTAGPEPGHLAVVTETGLAASVTESAGHIWAALARRYGPYLVLLEHYLAPELGEGMETLDLVRIGTDGSPHWSRVWAPQGPGDYPATPWHAAHASQCRERARFDPRNRMKARAAANKQSVRHVRKQRCPIRPDARRQIGTRQMVRADRVAAIAPLTSSRSDPRSVIV